MPSACCPAHAHLAALAELRRAAARAMRQQAALLRRRSSPPAAGAAAAAAAGTALLRIRRACRCASSRDDAGGAAGQRAKHHLVEQRLHLVRPQRGVKQRQLRQRALVAAAGVSVRAAAQPDGAVDAERPPAISVGLCGQAGVDVEAVASAALWLMVVVRGARGEANERGDVAGGLAAAAGGWEQQQQQLSEGRTSERVVSVTMCQAPSVVLMAPGAGPSRMLSDTAPAWRGSSGPQPRLRRAGVRPWPAPSATRQPPRLRLDCAPGPAGLASTRPQQPVQAGGAGRTWHGTHRQSPGTPRRARQPGCRAGWSAPARPAAGPARACTGAPAAVGSGAGAGVLLEAGAHASFCLGARPGPATLSSSCSSALHTDHVW